MKVAAPAEPFPELKFELLPWQGLGVIVPGSCAQGDMYVYVNMSFYVICLCVHAMQCNATQRNAMQCNATQWNGMECNAM